MGSIPLIQGDQTIDEEVMKNMVSSNSNYERLDVQKGQKKFPEPVAKQITNTLTRQ